MEVDNCSFCLDPITTKPPLNSKIFQCECSLDTFHPECLEKWITFNFSCPICRKSEDTVEESSVEDAEQLNEVITEITRDLRNRRRELEEIRLIAVNKVVNFWKKVFFIWIFGIFFVFTGKIIFLSFILLILFPDMFLNRLQS
jgi:hypothetical protein